MGGKMDIVNNNDLQIIEKIKETIPAHTSKIWLGVDGRYHTYVVGTKKLVTRKRIEDLYDDLQFYYSHDLMTKKEYEEKERNDQYIEKYMQNLAMAKPIDCYDIKKGNYLITPIGDIYSLSKKSWMITRIQDMSIGYHGQRVINLRKTNGKEIRIGVAKLVLTTFVGLPPEGMKDPTVDHIDGDSLNNYYKNLRWMERADNSSLRHQKMFGELNPKAILKDSDVIHICNMFVRGESTLSDIAELYGVSLGTIQSIYRKQNWTHITAWYEFATMKTK